VYGISRGPSGHIWTSHGIPVAADLDGYRVRRIPIDTFETRLSEAPDGQLWAPMSRPNTRTCIGVQRLVGDSWQQFPLDTIGGIPQSQVHVVAWLAGRVLVMTPDAILEFDAASRTTSVIRAARVTTIAPFLDMRPGVGGDVWVSGEHGVARLVASTPRGWEETLLPPRMHDAIRPIETREGLFVAARSNTNEGSLLRLQSDTHSPASRWTILSTSPAEDPIVAGWQGLDRWLWLIRSDGRAFTIAIRRADGLEISFRRMRALSGVLLDVEPDPDGGFWLATSLGVVRYLPTIWRREAELVGEDRHSGSLLETSSGDLYALQDHALERHSGDRWISYPLPATITANVTFSKVLGEVPGGRLVFHAGDLSRAFEFDPSTSAFSEVRHPEGRTIEVLGRKRPVGVWTITRATGHPARVESFDGTSFSVRATLDSSWDAPERPRAILETSAGDLFVLPGPTGVGLLHGSTVRWLTKADGLPGDPPITAAETPNGRIWFGSREGVLEFDGTRITTVRSGLQTVRSIITGHDGAVWVASNSGVHRYFQGSWLSLTDDDGLPDAAVIDLVEDQAGRLWASTTAGIALRHPEADHDEPETSLVAGRNPSEAPPSGDVGLSFTAVDRWEQTRTDRLLFSHRVDSGAWSPYTGETTAALTGLRAGAHTFAVRTMDRDGNVDRTPAIWSFTVLLPWYREPGAMAVGALGVAGLAMAMVLFVTRHRRLERLVQERTEALRSELTERQRVEAERARLEEQLVQSQKMEAIGRLAGGISHDFNNLLTVICSYGDLLVEEIGPDDPRRPHAEEIVKAASRAATLTRQLLAFSRHQAVDRQVIDLNAVLFDLMRMLSRLLGERVQLASMPADHLWPVLADRGQMEQVVINLVVNARDAMPDGGQLEIETSNVDLDQAYVHEHVESSAGPHVRLSVRDTGTGMDEATRSRIFEPFFTTKEVGKGSGLGLAMVYGIVRQSDGHIVVHSAPGRGTSFDVYLPRTSHQPAREAEARGAPPSRGTETILLVEDEPLVRDLAGHVLRRLGYRVTEATNAEEAIALVEERGVTPDLLVSDVVMPGLGGRELATRLRAQLPALAVLLMSGYTTDVALRDTTDAQTAFLQKPFTPARLADQVKQLLGRRQ